MAKDKKNKTTTVAYVSEGDTGPYASLPKEMSLVIDGKTVDAKTLNLPRMIEVYDKKTKTATVIGKLVVRKDDKGVINKYVQLNDNVGFKTKDGVVTSKFLSIRDKKDEVAYVQKLQQDGQLTEDEAQSRIDNMFFLQKLTISVPTE